MQHTNTHRERLRYIERDIHRHAPIHAQHTRVHIHVDTKHRFAVSVIHMHTHTESEGYTHVYTKRGGRKLTLIHIRTHNHRFTHVHTHNAHRERSTYTLREGKKLIQSPTHNTRISTHTKYTQKRELTHIHALTHSEQQR